MEAITNKEIEILIKSYQNAKELASKFFVLIQIARIKGLWGLKNYISFEILQGKSDSMSQLPKLLQKPEPILPLYHVLGILLGFICKGSISSPAGLKVIAKTLMHYYDITQELEKEILLTGVMAIQKGDNPIALKEELEKILSENGEKVQSLISKFFDPKFIEDESLIALWKSKPESGPTLPTDVEELTAEEEIDKATKKDIGKNELVSYDEFSNKIKLLISEKLEVELGEVTDDTSFYRDLGADSLDTYELIYAIEEEMGIAIPDEKANEFETVIQVLKYCWKQF